jgi:hypothetical protein
MALENKIATAVAVIQLAAMVALGIVMVGEFQKLDKAFTQIVAMKTSADSTAAPSAIPLKYCSDGTVLDLWGAVPATMKVLTICPPSGCTACTFSPWPPAQPNDIPRLWSHRKALALVAMAIVGYLILFKFGMRAP